MKYLIIEKSKDEVYTSSFRAGTHRFMPEAFYQFDLAGYGCLF